MRLNILFGFFIVLFTLTLFKLFDLSVNNSDYFLQVAENQRSYGLSDTILRGEVFIKDKLNNQLVTLATNKFVSASEVASPSSGIGPNGSGYKRFYPEGSLSSSVLGFLGFKGKDRVGQYGVEAYYETWLSGAVGTQNILDRFALGSTGSNSGNGLNPGSSLILTIDKNIQFFAETKLKELVTKWEASGGNIIIQDPKTGAILAMANYPAFDPNNYWEYSLERFLNTNIQETFEPGSSFKPITMAAALETDAVGPQTQYFDSGEVQVAGYTIKNYDLKSNGYQTMAQVLEKSINTGAIFAMRKTGQEKFLEFVEKFGFGRKTDIDIDGEVSGNIENLYSGREINFVTASFGQGVAVTPLQLVNAYSAIANGGKLMRPFVVEKIIKPNGESVLIRPEVVGEPVSPETASQLSEMLVSVIEQGAIKKARVAGYKIAGKTGTAQEFSPEGGYSEFLLHNLVGFGPVGDPQFTVMVKLDRPKGVETAAVSLADTFGDIFRFLFNYYEIPPSE